MNWPSSSPNKHLVDIFRAAKVFESSVFIKVPDKHLMRSVLALFLWSWKTTTLEVVAPTPTLSSGSVPGQ